MQLNYRSIASDGAASSCDFVGELSACTGSVDWAGIPPGAALAALAHLAPLRCIEIACERELTDALPRAHVAAAVSSALQLACDRPGEFAVPSINRALESFCGEIAAAALVRIAQAAPELNALQRAIDKAIEGGSTDPALLRSAIAIARQRDDATRLEPLFARLAHADPTPATLGFIARCRKTLAPSGMQAVKVALVSSYTVAHFAPFVEQACSEIGLRAEIYVAPFNSWTREAIDPASGLRGCLPEITFLAVAVDDLIPGLAGVMTSSQRERAGDDALARVLETARHYTSWAAGAPLVVHSFHSAFADEPAGLASSEREASRLDWLRALNLRLASELRALGCRTLDVQHAANVAAVSLGDAPKLRHIAAMHLPPQTLFAVAQTYTQYIAPLKGLTRKCVVVDLDNTLWGGVVGEDGKDALRLGETSPGSEFVEFQHFLKSLPERGILLALCSKNNEDEARDAIRSLPAMVLKEHDFSAIRINWRPKPENLLSIAQELNIGVDSLVFVDDNPDERELMRVLLPSVLTVEIPRDPALYRTTLERLPQLQVLTVTAEDRERPAQYATSRLREAARTTAASLDDYLRSLEIEVLIDRAKPATLNRVVQLFARTNQFNTTTRRYDLTDVTRFAAGPEYRLYTLESADRFGAHGLVAAALVEQRGNEARIDSFLMSCRVIGYGIETALLAHIAAQALADGAAVLRAQFVPTKKNAPATGLFEQHGFTPEPGSGTEVQTWLFPLNAGALPPPAWIAHRTR